MNFDPKNFFIGLVDFFSILLPGAILTYLIQVICGSELSIPKPEGAEYWVIFLFASYLLGHFLFLIGAWVLDEYVYDNIRDGTDAGQIRRLSRGEKFSRKVFRWLAKGMIKDSSDNTVKLAVTIKESHLEQIKAPSAVNAFQWCKARLALENPSALETVQRFEADSKFFRSLLVVLCILLAVVVWKLSIIGALGTLIMMLLSFWRYVDQRVKSTNQAYWFIITMEGNKGQLQAPAHETSHAGGVVFKKSEKGIEFLIVRAKDNSAWVLPKGHIEMGENARETAVREVREETGVWARVRGKLSPQLRYRTKNQLVKVQFYLMEALKERSREEVLEGIKKSEKPVVDDKVEWFSREHQWHPLEKAQELLIEDSTNLLTLADQKIKTFQLDKN